MSSKMIRAIERAHFGPRRDHFFHSFQNYFLGLTAIAHLRPWFEAFKATAKLSWQVDPFNVWFLTAMWHDVGYGLQHLSNVVESVLGFEAPDEVQVMRDGFLGRPQTQKGFRCLGSLIAYLLFPEDIKTAWMEPSPHSKLGNRTQNVIDAMRENAQKSHGVASALRLYTAFCDDLDKMDEDARAILLQTIFLASSSMPFHDWFFRDSVRRHVGQCQIPVDVMPFASLLTFIDTIQEDRRDIVGMREALQFVEKLLFDKPATVSAKINFSALPSDGILLKIVEGRDVLCSLKQCRKALFFRYPAWVTG